MRYFFGFLLAIGLVVVTFILVLRGFHTSTPPSSTQLISYANTDTVVQFTDDGAVEADQTHQGIRITVGQYAATLQIYQGYQDHVTQSQTFANNPAAYGVFLRSLQLLDYTSGNKDPSPALADSRGYCPLGQHYTFQIIDGNESNIQNFWATSCGGPGTFGGNIREVQTLFEAQVPNYPDIAGDVSLD